MLTLRNAVRFLVCLTLMTAGLSAFAADATGTWKWTGPGRQGNPGPEITATLKQDGEKLTGTVKQGQNETEIKDGKVTKEGEVSFSVTRKVRDNEITTKYSGKLEGDAIKGKAETERGGQARSRDWEAKRSKE